MIIFSPIERWTLTANGSYISELSQIGMKDYMEYPLLYAVSEKFCG